MCIEIETHVCNAIMRCLNGQYSELFTGVLKNVYVVSKYLHSGSDVFGCFLDASKAFDRVNHAVLFKLLMDRNLPCTVLHFFSRGTKT